MFCRPVEAGAAGGLYSPQISSIVDLLPIDNYSEEKKDIVKTYKPFQIPRILLVMHETNFDQHCIFYLLSFIVYFLSFTMRITTSKSNLL